MVEFHKQCEDYLALEDCLDYYRDGLQCNSCLKFKTLIPDSVKMFQILIVFEIFIKGLAQALLGARSTKNKLLNNLHFDQKTCGKLFFKN